MSEKHIHFHNPSGNLAARSIIKKGILGNWQFTNSTIGGADLFIRNRRNKLSTLSISNLISIANSVGSGTNVIATLPANAYISSVSTTHLAINNTGIPIFSIMSTFTAVSSLWVAVGQGYSLSNTILYSTNGSNWSKANQTITNINIDHYGIAYGNNLWVAVGGSIDQRGAMSTIRYSTDGSNWSDANNGFNSNEALVIPPKGRSVAYGKGLWVSVGQGSSPNNSILYGNGSNWSNAVSGGFTSTYGTGIAYGDGLWVATGYGNSPISTLKYSTDGSNWSNAVTGGFSNNFNGGGYFGNSVAYSTGLWVAVGSATLSTNSILYSVNGSNWFNALKGGFNNLNSIGFNIAYGNGLWVACGNGNSVNDGILYGDGYNWSNTTGGFGCYGLAYGNGLWVGTGYGADIPLSTIKYSTDGSNWYNSVSGGFTDIYVGYDVAYKPLTYIISYTSTVTYNITPLININSNTSINLVDNIFSLTYSSLTLKFTPKLMSTLISMM